MPEIIPCGNDDESDDEEEGGLEQNCDNNGSNQDSRSDSTLGDAPSLMSEPPLQQPDQTNRAPARYNPSSGESYVQACHNLVEQVQEKERSLVYDESEKKIVAHMLTKYRSCYAQQFMIGKGLRKFLTKGPPAVKSELDPILKRKCFKAVVAAELTRL